MGRVNVRGEISTVVLMGNDLFDGKGPGIGLAPEHLQRPGPVRQPESHTRAYVEALDLDAESRRRILIAISCHDSDSIPKVPQAGEVITDGELRYQLMHNGVKVLEGCYHGRWMTEIITLLKGHHEPQEEKVFHEVLTHLSPGATMVEVGSFWAYYSLWFRKAIAGATTYLLDPDPHNLAVGKRNFHINSADAHCFQLAIGATPADSRPFRCESDGVERLVARTSIDHFMPAAGVRRIDVLLADVQGAELPMLEGATESIREGKIRFLFLSTHHHSISGDPLTHQRCLRFLQDRGACIIAAHNVTESYSGDGLIVASFDDQDRHIQEINVSRNHPTNSLFRELEYDLHEALQELTASKRPAYRMCVSAMVQRINRRVKALISWLP